jgi:hypothetical protein
MTVGCYVLIPLEANGLLAVDRAGRHGAPELRISSLLIIAVSHAA